MGDNSSTWCVRVARDTLITLLVLLSDRTKLTSSHVLTSALEKTQSAVKYARSHATSFLSLCVCVSHAISWVVSSRCTGTTIWTTMINVLAWLPNVLACVSLRACMPSNSTNFLNKLFLVFFIFLDKRQLKFRRQVNCQGHLKV